MRHEEEEAEEVRQVQRRPSPAIPPPPSPPLLLALTARPRHRPRRASRAARSPTTLPSRRRRKATAQRLGAARCPPSRRKIGKRREKAEKARRATLHEQLEIWTRVRRHLARPPSRRPSPTTLRSSRRSPPPRRSKRQSRPRHPPSNPPRLPVALRIPPAARVVADAPRRRAAAADVAALRRVGLSLSSPGKDRESFTIPEDAPAESGDVRPRNPGVGTRARVHDGCAARRPTTRTMRSRRRRRRRRAATRQ